MTADQPTRRHSVAVVVDHPKHVEFGQAVQKSLVKETRRRTGEYGVVLEDALNKVRA